MRYAAGLSKLGGLLKQILPQSAGEWALRLGPEAGFAVIGAAMAPEGTALQDRIALGLEDLAIGTGSSFLGSAAGNAGGRMLFRAGTPNREARLAQAMTFGDIAAAPLPMLAPRPIANSVYEKALQGQSRREQDEAQQAEEERHAQEALMTSMVAGGGGVLLPTLQGSGMDLRGFSGLV
jgi:hypothetical protein